MTVIDFDGVNAAALRNGRSFFQELVPGGKFRSLEYVVKNPRRADERLGSFSINYKTGIWKDFATNEGGGDIVSFIAYVRNCSQGDAARELAIKLCVPFSKSNGPATNAITADAAAPNVRPAMTLVTPVPTDAPPPPIAHPTIGKPTAQWTYTDASGAPLGYVLRFDLDGAKEFRPLTLWRLHADGKLSWRWESWPDKRPLYGLERLAARPSAPVVVCEGEKATDAATSLLPGFVAVTSPNGSKSAAKADWLPLKGRAVTVWPDADPAGLTYAQDVAKLVIATGALAVAIVSPPTGVIVGWDAANALTDGWDQHRTDALIRTAMALTPETPINAPLDADLLRAESPHGEQILRKVYDFLGRFVVFPSDHAHVATALWVLHAHLIDRWESTPRLAFLSPEPGSGKTRALEILEPLVPRPVLAVNVSPAYLFRRMASEDGTPTILFDEIDTLFGAKAKEHEELRGFLNAGHRKGAVAGRCVVRGKTVETEDLPAYCAVALAALGWLPETILNRSIIVRMRRRHGGEYVEPWRRRLHAPEGERIYHQIEAWARSQPEEIEQWPKMPAEIQDRDADVWEALLVIADTVGGAWPERARNAAVALVAASKENEPSLGVQLLADMYLVFGDAEALSSKVILTKLQEIEEAPWGDIKGKPLDERGLARRLRQYDIRSKNIRIGTATPKGYVKVDFLDAWRRHPPGKSAASATCATNVLNQYLSVADVAPPVADVAETQRNAIKEKSHRNNGVAFVADAADLAAHRRPVCAQCQAPDDLQRHGDVWLHKECRRFWIAEHEQKSAVHGSGSHP